MARKTGKKNGIKVDLSGVETSKKAIPEGQYQVKVEAAEIKNSDSSGANYVSFTFEVLDDEHKGAKLFHNCSLQPQALFNLKSVLQALGFDIPGKAFDLDLEALIDLECLVEVTHEVYDGKKKARITDFLELDGDDDEEEEGDGEIDLTELDKAELVDLAKAVGISAKKIKVAKTEAALIALLEDEDEDLVNEKYDELFGEEDDEDGEDEDDEDEGSDYDEMTLKDLKALCRERGIKVSKGMSKEDMIKALEELDEEDDGDEDDDDDDQDYEDMSLEELKGECKERGIKVPAKAKNKQLIELLEADDEE